MAETTRERLVADLTDAALRAAAHHHVQGYSVDREVDLWKAMNRVVQEQPCRPADVRLRQEELLAKLTNAAYQVTLAQGFQDPFVDVEMDLWKALRRVVREGPVASPTSRGAIERAMPYPAAGR